GREQPGQLWQRRYLDSPLAGLIGLDGLLGHAQPFSQLGLGDAVFFAQAGNVPFGTDLFLQVPFPNK
ncbi:hypothetical protein QN382_23935, partial [Pseudomonas sp. 10B1]|nr:hypothetical protein [Pseudomonas sp. RTI1]MEB0128655.1 hypothetical protein [Pseudomonas sp. CCC1.2]MEB0156047.1 hypothetical protein [Pseudomonas sp. CCC4.3]MEB0222122.1 hypothetical protein [Pseudomonas sp. AB12(2023)]MEB0312290.1 hypothetical protein [Pseudomonas sp. 10B1]